jgi:hypothetical protein
MQNNTILIVVVVVVVVVYYLFFYKKETMTNVSSEQQQIIDQIYNSVVNNPDITFVDYIKLLKSLNNTNLDIINNEVFVTFKLLQKKKMFSKDDIVSEMKLQ